MKQDISGNDASAGWDIFDDGMPTGVDTENNEISRAFARCFKGVDGDHVLKHLRQTILDRRLGPRASDSELRYVEGQRSVVAHILSMLART